MARFRAAETLTERRIATLRPRESGWCDLTDAAMPGLIFRVRPNGWRGFALRYTAPSGRRRFLVLGPHGSKPPALTLAAARRRAGELLLEVRAGKDPAEARSDARRKAREEVARGRALARGEPIPGSFAHLAHCYLRDHAKKRKRTWREDERKIERELLPAWRERMAGTITRGDVRALVFAIAEGEGPRARSGRPAPIGANRTLALVSRIYSYAVDAEYPGVTANPAYRLARPAPERSRDRVLSEAELRALWTATEAEPLLPRVAVRLLLLSGLRRGELLGARWRELDEDERGLWLEISAERSKNGRPLRVALSTFAREPLRELASAADSGSDLLFPGLKPGQPVCDLNGPLDRLRRRVAEIAGEEADPRPWTIHDLRRTFRTMLAALGVPPGIAERCLGHTAPEARGVGGVYDRHSYAAERMAAAEALGRRVREIVTGERASVLPFYPRAGAAGASTQAPSP